MPFVPSKADGAILFYRDYRPSFKARTFLPTDARNATEKPALVFTAAWPFSSKMYDHLMLPLCESYGFRCVAIDRRGFGKSEWSGPTQPEQDIDYDTFADDLGQLLETCGVSGEGGFVGIGASLGCGELLLSLGKQRKLLAACRGLVFLGPSLPIPMQTARKSTGPPRDFWDSLLQRLRDDRWESLASALPYIWGEEGAKMLSSSEAARYEGMAQEADPFALERTVQIFLDRDFTDFLEGRGRTFECPILILHGGADVANPVEAGPGFIQANTPKTRVVLYDTAAHGETYLGRDLIYTNHCPRHCCNSQTTLF